MKQSGETICAAAIQAKLSWPGERQKRMTQRKIPFGECVNVLAVGYLPKLGWGPYRGTGRLGYVGVLCLL